MSLASRLRSWWQGLDAGGSVLRGSAFDGRSGRPPSGNGASSFHLFWDMPPGEWAAAECDWMIDAAPAVPSLFFWAMQASMVGGPPGQADPRPSAGHLGPQWCPPARRCINWGGYGPGGELEGSPSTLPSPDGNPNTREHPWRDGVVHRLRIERAEPLGPSERRRRWTGSVTDTETGVRTEVRDLYAAGERLDSVMVWSEVFARCDAPPVTVRWSGFTLVDRDGRRHVIERARVNYQAVRDGGCATTDTSWEGGWFVQRTGVERVTRQDAVLGPPRS